MTHDSVAIDPTAPRSPMQAASRGWNQRCPNCGTGRLYGRYLKVHDRCPACAEELHHQRADDAPPYFTMFIVAHVVIGGVLALEQNTRPEMWVHLAIWVPLTIGLSLWLLPRVKGVLIGYQWALKMHGFAGPDDRDAPGAEKWPAAGK